MTQPNNTEVRELKEALVSAARSAEIAIERLQLAEMVIEAARLVAALPTASGLHTLERAIYAYDAQRPS